MKALILLIVAGLCAQAFALPRVSNPLHPRLAHKVSFDELFNRYPSPYAVVQEFKQIVPKIDGENQCLNIDESSAPVLGMNDPMQGGPLENEPGALFWQYYQDCVKTLVDKGFATIEGTLANSNEIMGLFFTVEWFGAIGIECAKPQYAGLCAVPDNQAFAIWRAFDWSSYPVQGQLFLLQKFISYLIGPEAVLRDQNYIGEQTAFGIPVKDSAALAEFLNEQIKNKNVKASDVYAQVAILLRLGPALKQ